MRTALLRPRILVPAVVVVLAIGALVWIAMSTAANPSAGTPAAPGPAPVTASGTAAGTGSASPGGQSSAPTDSASAPASAVDCPPATVTVASAAELAAALAAPSPGTVIRLADGVYTGNFTATGNGTPDSPVMLCGTGGSILDGGQLDDGYVLHLNQASYWVLQGFTVRNGQKGVMVDQTTHSVLRGLTVSTTGDEAIHLRKFSTDNKVLGNVITDTGKRKPKFGEGIYVGTAESNWCDVTSCEPDKSDRNEISGNDISGTTAECIDIKEGTSGGVVRDNRFDGSRIVGADSWVDIKGNDWRIENNSGRNSPMDGFQTHEILDGWGTGNVFRNNTAEVNGPGFGYSLTPVLGNALECSNKATQAGKGLSNAPCTSV